MNVDATTLSSKIKEMFPELDEFGVVIEVKEDPAIKSWDIRLSKDKHVMSACLDSQDAENCLAGKECTAFCSEIGQFVHSYCRHSKECPVGG